jgi:hypothetical protein
MVALCLAFGLLAVLAAGGPDAYAQGDAPPPPDAAASPGAGDELPGVETPASPGAGGGGPRPVIDPFRALIEPKVEAPLPVLSQPAAIPVAAAAAPPPPAPPVQFKVNAVAGEHPHYVAVIEYEGQTYIVQKDTKVPDDNNVAFDVRNVTSEKVEVFDRRTNRLVQKQLVTD